MEAKTGAEAGEFKKSTQSLPTAGRVNRRRSGRYAVDCTATVTPLSGAGSFEARILDLSQGGCRLSTPERVSLGILSRVEVCFQMRGVAFRIVGVTAGTRTGRSFGVRFVDLPARRAKELAELVVEIEAAAGTAQPVLAMPAQGAHPVVLTNSAIEAAAAKPDDSKTIAASKPSDRRAHNRHEVDTRVNLTLVRGAITMRGCILNLSEGGCRLRTDERFKVGIYTRVEAEFFLRGLPFRLAGVSQAIMDQNTIGIRFLDMSQRKREQLQELIAEIEAAERAPRTSKMTVKERVSTTVADETVA